MKFHSRRINIRNPINAAICAVCAASILVACGKHPTAVPPPTTAAAPVPTPAATQAAAENAERKERLARALAAVKREKRVRDASWLNERPASLLAGVLDDGSKQDGYAGFLCMLVAEHGVHGGTVRVMDVAAATRNEWRELGRADCPEDGPVEWVDFTKGVK